MRGKGLIASLLVSALAGAAVPAAASARAGDLYVSDVGEGAVLRMDPRTGDTETIASGPLSIPDGLDFDRRGNIFLTDYDGGPGNDGAVYKLNPRTEVLDPVLLGGGLLQPLDLVVGPDRRIYVSDLDAEAIFRLKPTNGAIATLADGSFLAEGGPLGIDRAPNGALFTVGGDAAAMGNAFGVIRVRLGNGAQRLVGVGPNPSDAYGFAVAPNGRTAWVGDSQFHEIYRVNLRTGAVRLLNTTGVPIAGPTALALAPNRDLFVANFDDQNVLRVNTRTGVATQVGTVTGNAEGITIEPPRCGGLYATVTGTTRGDRIRGSRFGDVIATLGGRDTVRGLGGKDIICTGKGRDRLFGGRARDRLLGGPGPDSCDGGPGRDRQVSC